MRFPRPYRTPSPRASRGRPITPQPLPEIGEKPGFPGFSTVLAKAAAFIPSISTMDPGLGRGIRFDDDIRRDFAGRLYKGI